MATTFSTSYVWKGEECELEGSVIAADPSVGLMSPGLEEITLKRYDGTEIELTDAEREQIDNDPKLWDKLNSWYYSDLEDL